MNCNKCNRTIFKTVEYKGLEYVKAHKCTKCNKDLCGKCAICYVDESNEAITKNSPDYCKECYIEVYKKLDKD